MTFKFLQSLLHTRKATQSVAGKSTLKEIASDLAEKRTENNIRQERVEDAIKRGTRITKRRIPL